MKTLIKSRNRDEKYWRLALECDDEIYFAADRIEFARYLNREDFDRAVIDFTSLTDTPLLEYMRLHHPNTPLILLTGEDMRSAIESLRTCRFVVLDREFVAVKP